MNWQAWVAILGILGGGGGIAAAVRVFTEKPKIRADAVKIITDAAGAQVERMAERLEKVEAKVDEQGKQIDLQHDYQVRVADWHHRHRPYDDAAQALATKHGEVLPTLAPFPEP